MTRYPLYKLSKYDFSVNSNLKRSINDFQSTDKLSIAKGIKVIAWSLRQIATSSVLLVCHSAKTSVLTVELGIRGSAAAMFRTFQTASNILSWGNQEIFTNENYNTGMYGVFSDYESDKGFKFFPFFQTSGVDGELKFKFELIEDFKSIGKDIFSISSTTLTLGAFLLESSLDLKQTFRTTPFKPENSVASTTSEEFQPQVLANTS